jgi:hypothetical protein
VPLLDVLADRRRGALLAAVLGALVYLNAIPLGFAWDDVEVIQSNEALHSWAGIVGGLDQPYWPGHFAAAVGAWRPVASTWWGLQWLAWGDTPALFHLVGVLLHAAATGLLVVVLCELLPVPAAVLGGLVFAVHPVHVEAVANVIGSAEVIAAVFVLGACLLHLRAAPHASRVGERYGWGRSAAVGTLFAFGALAKEIAYTLPALLFVLDAARRDISPRDLPAYLGARWRPYGLMIVVAGVLLLARSNVLGGLAPEQAPVGASILMEMSRVWTVPAIWSHYVRLMLFPADLSPDYGGIIPVMFGWGVENLTGIAIALTFLAFAWWAWRSGGPMRPEATGPGTNRRVLGFAVVWFGVAVFPASNILFLSPVLVAERNLYIPSIGMAAAAGWLLAELFTRRRQAALLATTTVLALMSLRTVTRNPVWNDTRGLFIDEIQRHPQSARAWFFHSDRLWREGMQAEARRAFSVLMLLTDSDYLYAVQVGSRLSGMERASPRAAEFFLERAWSERPRLYTAPGMLAVHHLNHRQFERGEAPARAAVTLAPENPDMHRVLAGLLSGQGRPSEAIPWRLSGIERGGGARWTSWFWLAGDYAAVGDVAAARMALDSARVHAPSAEALAAIAARLRDVDQGGGGAPSAAFDEQGE